MLAALGWTSPCWRLRVRRTPTSARRPSISLPGVHAGTDGVVGALVLNVERDGAAAIGQGWRLIPCLRGRYMIERHSHRAGKQRPRVTALICRPRTIHAKLLRSKSSFPNTSRSGSSRVCAGALASAWPTEGLILLLSSRSTGARAAEAAQRQTPLSRRHIRNLNLGRLTRKWAPLRGAR